MSKIANSFFRPPNSSEFLPNSFRTPAGFFSNPNPTVSAFLNMQLAGPYSSAFLNMQLAGKAMLWRDPSATMVYSADSAVVVRPKHFQNTHMAPMNFKLVSIWSESDRIETELEIRRGPITQSNAPYLAASCCSAQTMSVREQSVLQRAWSQAPRGRLSPWMEAKAWGLREGWRDFHDGSEHGMLTWISKRVTKGGGDNPTVEAVRLLFEKISSDPDWFPGKLYGSPGGRPSALSEQKKAVIATCCLLATLLSWSKLCA